MKFQNCSLKHFERTHDGRSDGRTDGRTNGPAQSNMPLQLFQSWGHNENFEYNYPLNTLVNVYVDLVVFTRIAGTS